MVWSFPDRIPAGRVEDRPVLSLDIAATALDAAGLPAVADADGKSLLKWINGSSRQHPHDKIYWRMAGGKMAYRQGNWKIVRPKRGEPIELYHLAGDVAESRNLVSKHPAKLRELVNQSMAMDSQMAEPIVLPK